MKYYKKRTTTAAIIIKIKTLIIIIITVATHSFAPDQRSPKVAKIKGRRATDDKIRFSTKKINNFNFLHRQF